MKLKEVQELLEKLKPLENSVNSKKGTVIHRFFIVPLDFLDKNDLGVDWIGFWSKDYAFTDILSDKVEYNIVGVHRHDYSTFIVLNDIEYIKSLLG